MTYWLDKIFLTVPKILPCHNDFLANLIFAIIAQMFCGNHLNMFALIMWQQIKGLRMCMQTFSCHCDLSITVLYGI